MSQSHSRIARLALLLVASWLLATAPANAFRDPGHDHGELLPQLDVRDDDRRMKPLPAAAAAGAEERAALRRTLGNQGWVDLDPLTGTPRTVAKLDGFLTEPSESAPAKIALDWVRDHGAVFGLDSAEIDALSLTRSYTDLTGTTHLIWAQELEGVPVFEHGLMANVDADGRLINVLGSPVPNLALRSVLPKLTAGAALRTALDDAGGPLVSPRVLSVRSEGLETRFAGGHDARLVIFNESPGALRLAWRITANAGSVELYDYVIDAGSGRILSRDNLVEFFSGKAWDYFPAGTYDAADAADGGDGRGICEGRTGCPYRDGQTQKPRNFATSNWVNAAATPRTLNGDYTHVYFDLQDSIDGFQTSVPTEAEVDPDTDGSYDWEFKPNTADWGCGPSDGWGNGNDLGMACSWDSNTADSWKVNDNQNATQIFYFVNKFSDHVKQAPIGFNEASGNFEADNGAAGGAGGDAVQAQALDGANTASGLPDENHLNNANMATRTDGTPPQMQMYLMADFGNSVFFDTNSGDDASVIYHEYVHGMSSRLVLDSSGAPALRSHQSGAMGEAWSDFYALDFLVGEGFDVDTEANGVDADANGRINRDITVGYYVGRGIRPQPMDCLVSDGSNSDCPAPTSEAGSGGFTYGDMLKISGGQPSVHRDGNIWSQVLWEIRQTLSAGGTNAAGLARAREIITNGMRLSVPNPSFVDMRNGIIQAERTAGGTHLTTLWEIFARRGLGYFAASKGGNDLAPKENFSPPTTGSSTLTGKITETETHAPVAGATVELLGPGDLAATTDSNGVYKIQNVPPGSYPYLTAVAPGHEPQVKENVSIGSGSATLDLPLHRDWAAVYGGSGSAEVGTIAGPDFTSQGCGPVHALDTVQGTGWGTTSAAPQDPQYASAGGPKSFVVKLPQEVDISSFAVDPTAICGDDATASLGGYKIETSNDGTTYTQAHVGSFSSSSNNKYNVLIPTAGAKRVRYVRMTMNQPQGGSGESFKNFMDMTELMVFGKPSPPPDSDGDGVPDGSDACPTQPAAGGCPPPPDADGDGVVDAQDRCPSQAGPAGNGGCPLDRRVDEGVVLTPPAVSRANLKSLVRNGLRVRVGCSAPCRLSVALSIDGRLARKLRLTKSRRAKRVTVGVVQVPLPAGGRKSVAVKLSPKAKKAFVRKRRRLPKVINFTLRITGSSPNGFVVEPVVRALKLRK